MDCTCEATLLGSSEEAGSLVVDPVNHTVTVLFDAYSVPSITELVGTRFAVVDDRRPRVRVDRIGTRCRFRVRIEGGTKVRSVVVTLDGSPVVRRKGRRLTVGLPKRATDGPHVLGVVALDRKGKRGTGTYRFRRARRSCATVAAS